MPWADSNSIPRTSLPHQFGPYKALMFGFDNVNSHIFDYNHPVFEQVFVGEKKNTIILFEYSTHAF